jgi:hypothetical protein
VVDFVDFWWFFAVFVRILLKIVGFSMLDVRKSPSTSLTNGLLSGCHPSGVIREFWNTGVGWN